VGGGRSASSLGGECDINDDQSKLLNTPQGDISNHNQRKMLKTVDKETKRGMVPVHVESEGAPQPGVDSSLRT